MNTRFCPCCRRNFGNLDLCPQDQIRLLRLPDEYPRPGTVIDGEFELYQPFAAGGMSRVYRAYSRRNATPLAVKALDPKLATHPYTIERFYREARVMATLEHANVVDVLMFGSTAEGHHVIVMELLGGESLGSVLRRETSLGWERALHILIELCDALGHAHGRRVVHRDIKPDNIQLMGHPGPNERVKLMDFGIAYVAADTSFRLPAPGSMNVSGTPAYMSPEQVRGLPLDGRSDVYALGVLLFELLAGRLPFPGDDPIAVCRSQLYDQPPRLSDTLTDEVDVPPQLHPLVRQMLAKSRSSRVPSVGAVMGHLLSILPQERWPTRIRRQRDGRKPTTRFRTAMRGTVRDADGESFRPEPHLRLAMLYLVVESSIRSTGAAAWPQSVDGVLADWRAAVEQAGGYLQQPEPDSLQIVFGLFRPARRSADIWHAILHGRRLATLLASELDDPNLELRVRAAVVRARTVEQTEAAEQELGLDPRDQHVAAELAKVSPHGHVSVDRPTRDELVDYVRCRELDPVRLPGTEELVPVFVAQEAKL